MSGNSLSGSFFYDLSGGINLSKTRIGLGGDTKKLFWHDSFNVEILKNQGVCSQKGSMLLMQLDNEDEGASKHIKGIYEYPKNSDSFVFVTQDGKIYHYDSKRSTYSLKYSFENKISKVSFAHFLDGILIVTPENEGVFFNLGASKEFTPLGAKGANDESILSATVAIYASRVWISQGSTLYFSALGRVDDWESPEDAGYISKFHSSSSEITAMREYKGCLAIYKQDGIYLLSGGNPGEFTIERFADLGVNSHSSVITDNNKQYFMNNDGVFALEQSGELAQIALSNNVAFNIQPYFGRLNFEKTSHALAVPYKIANQIWFFPPLLGEEFLNTIWIYDYFCKAWFKRVIPYEITCGASILGKVYTASAQGEIFIENIGNTFAGKPIEFRFSTPFFHLGAPNTRKIIENLHFIFDQEAENCFKFSVSKDYIEDGKTDIEQVNPISPITLIFDGGFFNSVWAEADSSETTGGMAGYAGKVFFWAEPYEEGYRVEVFDSNTSVQLHIEGEKLGDEFAIIGIEFKEVLLDD